MEKCRTDGICQTVHEDEVNGYARNSMRIVTGHDMLAACFVVSDVC